MRKILRHRNSRQNELKSGLEEHDTIKKKIENGFYQAFSGRKKPFSFILQAS
jgi:hypothetical protein